MTNKRGIISIFAPMSGKVVDLDEVPDAIYSKRIMGEGVAIEPSDGTLYSPINGYLTVVSDNRHAFGFSTDDGVELLVHVGIGSTDMADFTVMHKQVGARVQAGDIVADFSREILEAMEINFITPVIVCGGIEGKILKPVIGEVEAGAGAIFTIENEFDEEDEVQEKPTVEAVAQTSEAVPEPEVESESESMAEEVIQKVEEKESEVMAFLRDRSNWFKMLKWFLGITVTLIIIFVSAVLLIGH